MPGCGMCNPFCGKCKPPMERGLQCPVCQRYYFPEFMKDRICKNCGADLPDRIPRPAGFCNYSGQMCAKPCRRQEFVPKDGVVMTCVRNTRPKSDHE